MTQEQEEMLEEEIEDFNQRCEAIEKANDHDQWLRELEV